MGHKIVAHSALPWTTPLLDTKLHCDAVIPRMHDASFLAVDPYVFIQHDCVARLKETACRHQKMCKHQPTPTLNIGFNAKKTCLTMVSNASYVCSFGGTFFSSIPESTTPPSVCESRHRDGGIHTCIRLVGSTQTVKIANMFVDQTSSLPGFPMLARLFVCLVCDLLMEVENSAFDFAKRRPLRGCCNTTRSTPSSDPSPSSP